MHARSTRLLHRAKALVLAVGIAAAIPLIGATAASAQLPTQPSHFIVTATSSNITGSCVFINNGATDGNPSMLLYVTPNFSPGGTGGVADNAVQVGVDYDTSNAEWCIFNEDGSAMQAGQAFNVLAVPPGGADAFQVTATTSNSSGDSTYLNSSVTNGLPHDVLLATPVYKSAYENHIIGVWYDGSDWAVFNEDESTMDTSGNAVFNVLVGTTDTAGGKNAIQKSNNANRGGNSTHVSNPVTNGDPNAFVLETPNYDPNDNGASLVENATGIWYQSGQIVVFNENNDTMARNQDFNLLMFNS
jgi:hypothetical protein